MGPQSVRRGDGAPGGRVIVNRQLVAAQDLSVVLATEDVRAPTDWCLEEVHHTVVVHLAGNLKRMESVFSRGPSSDVLPSIGDIWAIPAGCKYAALAQGEHVSFAEIRVPVELLGGGELLARVAHRDPFLSQASARAAALAQRDDDLGRMALTSLLEAMRYHIADAFLGKPRRRAGATEGRRRFSDRQKQRLVDYIAATMHEPLGVGDLAAATGVTATRLLEGFKASFGTTPWQYVLRARLAEARRLLDTGDDSVTAISVATGFSSPSHLATSFRTHFGLSPAAFRREPRDRGAGDDRAAGAAVALAGDWLATQPADT